MSKSMSTDAHEPVGATRLSTGRLLAPGQDVLGGRFRVEALLGTGGMGEVYAAEQTSLGRKVALKVLSADMSLVPGMTERFRREALLLSSIDHPAVVRIIDFGEWSGSPCLVMELVRGESLEALARGGPMPPERAVPMLLQLAEGLAAIHAAGIVHRDLKLENVIVTETAKGEQARLLDFGIARLAQPDAGPAATQAGIVLGTPEYMAPEQALGHAVDARSDLYAWGVLAHRLLAGAHPFAGPTARDFVLQHISAEPVPLAKAAPHLGSRPALVELVARCLRKEPDARPRSALELIEALRAPEPRPIPLVTQPVTGRTAEFAARAVMRSPIVVATLGGAVLLTLVAAAAIASYRSAPHRVAGRQLEDGDARGALATLRVARARQQLEPAAWVLEARALHQLSRHEEESVALAELPAPELQHVTDGDVLALVEDFGRDEKSRERHEQLNRLAQAHFEALKAAARADEPDVRWGAARYLDAWGQAPDAVVDGYIASLGDADCARRGTAARRLGELGDERATEALERLKALPRKRSFLFEESCGHNEAAQALKKLGTRRGP